MKKSTLPFKDSRDLAKTSSHQPHASKSGHVHKNSAPMTKNRWLTIGVLTLRLHFIGLLLSRRFPP